MDPRTLRFYNRKAAEIAETYRKAREGISCFFEEAFPLPGGRIFDIGCGSGRDLHLLLSRGYDAFGCEPVRGLREVAQQAYSELKGRIHPFGLPLLPAADCGPPYRGVLCSAVLMHLPDDLLLPGVASIRRLLVIGGRLLVSVPGNRPGLNADWRDADGRLFSEIPGEKLLEAATKASFRLMKEWESPDSLDRATISWHTYLFESF